MQGFVFSGSVKSQSFCKRTENSKPQSESGAGLHFQEGPQRITSRASIPIGVTLPADRHG